MEEKEKQILEKHGERLKTGFSALKKYLIDRHVGSGYGTGTEQVQPFVLYRRYALKFINDYF